MIGKTNAVAGGKGDILGEKLNVSLRTNQADHSDLIGATLHLQYANVVKEMVWNGKEITLTVPPYIEYSVTFGDVADYRTPQAVTYTAQEDNSRSVVVEYQTTIVKASVKSNQPTTEDLADATMTISGKILKNGESAKFATGTKVTPTWSEVEDYRKPASSEMALEGASVTIEGTYETEVVSVSVSADNGESMSGVSVTIDGESFAYGGAKISKKIAFGKIYSVSVSDVEDYITPNEVTYTASMASRVVSMQYEEIKDETLIVNVSASDGASVDGQVVTVKQNIANGVYIEDVNGKLWTESEWNGSVAPNGVAVVTNECQFVMALELLPENYKWGGRGTAVSGIATTTAKATAVTDYNGKTNTETIINALKGVTDDYNSTGAPAAEACVSYVFPNGKNGYLGSMGEWKAIIDNTGLINTALSKVIGKNGLWDGGSWTSTQYNGNNAWLVSVGTELTYAANYKSDSMNVRPLTTLGNSKPITNGKATFTIPNGTTYEVSVSDKEGYATPASQAFTAASGTRTVSMQYIVIPVTDLSKVDIYGNAISQTTANCYVVSKADTYKIPLVFGNSLKNGSTNSAAYTKNSGSYSHDFVDFNGTKITSPYIETVSGTATSAQLSIADTDGIFTDISIVDGSPCRYLQFKVNSVPATGANGVLSIKNSSGVIMWSWHIWVWADSLATVEITNSTSVKYKILPVNLASKWDDTAKTKIKNWFYQFGRPNPMLCPSAYNSTSNHASFGSLGFTTASAASHLYKGIQNPTTFFKSDISYYDWFKTNSGKTYNLWDAACTSTGNSDNNVVKTIYDPSPIGFKMPNGNTFIGFSIITNANGIVKFTRYSGDTTGIGFPMSGYVRHLEGFLEVVGSIGYVWLSSASSQGYAYCLYFSSSFVNPQNYLRRAYGYSVRPVQE